MKNKTENFIDSFANAKKVAKKSKKIKPSPKNMNTEEMVNDFILDMYTK